MLIKLCRLVSNASNRKRKVKRSPVNLDYLGLSNGLYDTSGLT